MLSVSLKFRLDLSIRSSPDSHVYYVDVDCVPVFSQWSYRESKSLFWGLIRLGQGLGQGIGNRTLA